MFTFEDLEKLVEEAKAKGIYAADPVMFILETEDKKAGLACVVNGSRIQAQSTDGEGNVTSVGGTLWLYGTEY